MKQKIGVIIIIISFLLAGFWGGYWINEYLSNKIESEKIEEPKPDDKQEETIYEKLLKGDFSGIAGDYVSNSNEKPIQIFYDGNVDTGYFITKRISEPKKNEDGSYIWNYVVPGEPSEEFVIIYPEGVKVFDGTEYVETDTSKIRMIMGNGHPTKESIRYKKPKSDKCDTRDIEKIYQILKQTWGKFYTNSEPRTMVILDFYGNFITDGTVYARYTDITKNEDGSYTWGIYNPKVNYTAQPLTFYPVGVEIYQNGTLVETSTKVDRFIFDSNIYAKSILDQYNYTGMPE